MSFFETICRAFEPRTVKIGVIPQSKKILKPESRYTHKEQIENKE